MENFDRYTWLSKINSPSDLKAVPADALPTLALEIRDYLSFRVRENGGHLSSNLGVVELTMALHRVFDSPRDHVIFDVGHQSYVHKLLTGRADRFHSIRQFKGLSGFCKRSESEHDAYGAGHAAPETADQQRGQDAEHIAQMERGFLTSHGDVDAEESKADVTQRSQHSCHGQCVYVQGSAFREQAGDGHEKTKQR